MKVILLGSLLFILANNFVYSGRTGVEENEIDNNETKARAVVERIMQVDLPINPHAELLEKELETFRQIQSRGGWGKIPVSKKNLRQGQSHIIIKEVKERLRVTGEFESSDTSQVYNSQLVPAVKKAQRMFGFKEDGIIHAPLIKELNVPVEKRIEQLEVNIRRMRAAQPKTQGTHLVANIPEFKLHVYEDGKQVFEMPIVVGTETNKTAVFNDEMTHIVFSPYWNVPTSIVKNEILPAMRRNRAYLRRNNYEITGNEDGLPVIRQKPGRSNSLGQVKFVFPNNHAIYFHDTPAKSLFTIRKRTFSHGCIRLAEPAKLAEYLLRNSSGWTPSKIENAMDSGKEQWVKLETPVPVSITYYTAWVDKSGLLNFREDIYNKD